MPLLSLNARWLLVAVLLFAVTPALATNRDNDIGWFDAIPVAPRTTEPVTVRIFINHGANYVGTHSHTFSGNVIDVTAVQDGFSRSPNPPRLDEIFAEELGPLPAGTYDIRLHLDGADGSSVLFGGVLLTVVADPDTHVTQVIEYYNARLDHYFMTADPNEVADLDAHRFEGWARTGQSFNVNVGHVAGTEPVCRYYIPPEHGDSHFFSAFPAECEIIIHSIAFGEPPQFDYFPETATAFFVALPRPTGDCDPQRVPVYRLWNGRLDSNHRYTTDLAIRAAMIAQGYIPEGLGPESVAFCASA